MAYDPLFEAYYDNLHEPDTPRFYLSPDWEEDDRVHNWKNYISEEVKAMWDTFTGPQKRALARQAEEEALREEWD